MKHWSTYRLIQKWSSRLCGSSTSAS